MLVKPLKHFLVMYHPRILKPVVLEDSNQPNIPATSGPCSALFVAQIELESPVLSLMHIDNLTRTYLAVHLSYKPAEYIWILFVSQLLKDTRSKHRFSETLSTAVIPPGLFLHFSEENLRDVEFLDNERLKAHDMSNQYAQKLVYQAEDGERRLHDLITNVGNATGKYNQGGERKLHSGRIPVRDGITEVVSSPDATNTVSQTQLEFDMSQRSAAYDFFKSFGALYYETFGPFFGEHDDQVEEHDTQVDGGIGKPMKHYLIDKMLRTLDVFEGISILKLDNLPRDISFMGQNLSFLEVMRMEIFQQRRDYSVKHIR